MRMKNKIIFCLLIMGSYIFADANVENSFSFKKVEITSQGWLEPQYLKDSDYEECLMFFIKTVSGIENISIYPSYHNKTDRRKGKIEINNQEFIYEETSLMVWSLWFEFLKIYSISYRNKSYMILTGDVGKYGDKICLIFDITNPKRIIFYPPEEKIIYRKFAEDFASVYQDKLCFLFSEWRDDNLKYKLAFYFIDGGVLKPLCDEKGNPYYINYSFLDKYEQQMVTEEKYLP